MEIFRSWGVADQIRAGELGVRPLCSVSPTLRTALPEGCPLGFPTDPRAVLARSPALPACVPQDHIEPVLLDHLRLLGGEVRFGVELVELTDRGDGVHATLRDRTTGAHGAGGAPGSSSAPTARAATCGARSASGSPTSARSASSST